jgi:ribosome-binding protein aMBF1 (putative translation factor)
MARRDPETNPAAFLGGELRRARVAAGFSSQDALAAKIGFDRTVVAKAETGERPPDRRGAGRMVPGMPPGR